jgi:hypothetical protein
MQLGFAVHEPELLAYIVSDKANRQPWGTQKYSLGWRLIGFVVCFVGVINHQGCTCALRPNPKGALNHARKGCILRGEIPLPMT